VPLDVALPGAGVRRAHCHACQLGFSYRSRFFGHNILRDGPSNPRALTANDQTVGYYDESGRIVELRPNARVRVVDASGHPVAMDELSRTSSTRPSAMTSSPARPRRRPGASRAG
jgi:hypothetical protein